MSSPPADGGEMVYTHLIALSNVVREMTAIGARKITVNSKTPERCNLVAWPQLNSCLVCGLPGHKSMNVNNSTLCRTAILSLLGFWEDVIDTVSFLHQHSERFEEAIAKNDPAETYEARHQNPTKGGSIETVLVDQLTRNYLKFQSHIARIRPKAAVILQEQDTDRYEQLTEALNGYFFHEKTLSDLFSESEFVRLKSNPDRVYSL